MIVDTCSINDETIFSSLGRQELFVATPDQVWTPTLKFVTNAESNVYMKGNNIGYDLAIQASKQAEFQVLDFWYLIYGKFDSICPMQLSQFPLDQQNCTFKFQTAIPKALLEVQNEK